MVQDDKARMTTVTLSEQARTSTVTSVFNKNPMMHLNGLQYSLSAVAECVLEPAQFEPEGYMSWDSDCDYQLGPDRAP